ncbi:MAG: response regulator, partial [Gammaproteobacteria bacterium]|nr:response regulator [Gammaproteobacteria bacterium]
MNSNLIRVLLVDADPQETGALPKRMKEVEGIEVVGVAYNRNAAIAQVEELQPDVLVVDLMLPGIRSIDLVRMVAGDQTQVRILALVPADPPHDRIMLAAKAGALGYVCRDALASEFAAAIEQVQRGEPWLPLQQTYNVLQDGAGELSLSSQVRRTRLTEVLMGVIPLTGLIAAITASLWRHYWGDIGVRVTDLGVDPTSRMIDVLVVLVAVIGIAGPLLFVRYWVKDISKWIANQPRLARIVNKLRSLHLGKLQFGRLLINYWVAWVLLALLVFSIMLVIARAMPLIMAMFIGPAVIIIL